jgi:uncharacterized protein (DUF983 family)
MANMMRFGSANPGANPWPSIGRGLAGRCPHCGNGALFRAYLKTVESCASCGEPLARIRADDGPAWLTILIVGHVVAGLALLAEVEWAPPVWASVLGFCTLALVLCLWLLPRAKGLFIGAIWAMKAPGSGAEGPASPL